MTTRPTEERIAHLKSVTLPESSRMRMREELSAYADLHSLSTATTGAGSKASALTPSVHFSYFSASFFRISAALVVLVSMLGGTAYAANDALPGQPLYQVKLNLTEPVQTALIPSVQGKAAWHAILAERRLEEATDLAVAGKLDASTQGTITDNFAQHVQDSSAAATQLQEQGDVTAALSARSDLEARITAHEDILTQVVTHLAQDSTSDSSSETATKGLLAVVHESQATVQGERLALEGSLAMLGTTDATSTTTTASGDAKIAAQTNGAGGTDATVAIATAEPVPTTPTAARARGLMRPAVVSPSSTARKSEIAAILFKNSALLKALGSTGTTTASTTMNIASSTTTTSDGSTSSVDAQPATVNTSETTQSEVNIKK